MNAHVVYATITGNNEEVADVIITALQEANVNTKKTEISQTEVEELNEVDIAVIVPYTYDNGSLPDEGLDFFEDLENTDLSGVVYGVSGSGDTYYVDDFCLAVPKFESQLAKTNAIKGADSVKINLRPDEQDVVMLKNFVQQLIKTAQTK
ncbi:flavodoxin [Leuconostoc palmae]|uniref:flavodoxin n=1 Tax=Leuconostoc palmae TaxID=501487 RepID=UPI001C7CF23E|nr:flavodoxin [Leuconostoc palmae]